MLFRLINSLKCNKGIEQHERLNNKNVEHALKTVTSHSKYSSALKLLTEMSELNCNDKDGFPQVCHDVF